MLTDTGFGSGKTPQQPASPPLKTMNPAHTDRDPAFVAGGAIHASRSDGSGSRGCILQKGFEGKKGLHPYLLNSPTGQQGRVVIFRFDE